MPPLAHLPRISEILLPGDTMNALPAAKMTEIASGGRCKESYHACIMPTCHGLADKVGQVGNLGYHFLPTRHGLVRFYCQVMR